MLGFDFPGPLSFASFANPLMPAREAHWFSHLFAIPR